jgi:hypothetical protein
MEIAQLTEFAGSVAALALIPLFAIVLGGRWIAAQRRNGADVGAPAAAIFTGAAVAWIAALGVARTVVEGNRGYHGCGYAPGDEYIVLMDTFGALDVARRMIWAAAAVGAAAALAFAARARRQKRGAAPSFLPAALALFSVGVASFVATRTMAHDAGNPVPFWDAAMNYSSSPLPALPAAASSCSAGLDAPRVIVFRGKALVDGAEPTPDAPDLRRALLDKRRLWEMIAPNRPFPGHVVFAAAVEAPVAEIAPLLEAARDAGYRTAGVLAAFPAQTFQSQTLGEIGRTPRECQILRLDLGAPIPAARTWGELAMLGR